MITERCLYSETVTIAHDKYDIICIPDTDWNRERIYSFYIQPSSRRYTMSYMYAVPAEQQSVERAFDLAINHAMLYIDDYKEDWKREEYDYEEI